jgi:hypothetical protein
MPVTSLVLLANQELFVILNQVTARKPVLE